MVIRSRDLRVRYFRRWPLSAAAGVLVAALSACGPGGPGADDDCGAGEASCGDVCIDVTSDSSNCGGCGVTCDTGAGETCSFGECRTGAQTCNPGEVASCYSGVAGTEGVGPCVAGTQTCAMDGSGFGPCIGEVAPITEICANSVDDDCNGTADEEADNDGDGWTNCDGDCCDTAGAGCADPELVNPGSFEVAGNEVDDDCDGTVDNPVANCDTGLPSNSNDAMQYAAAMDLCQTADENPAPGDTRWGVISAQFLRADGTGAPSANARSIRGGFGATTTRLGDSLVTLSTGNAAATGDTNPAFAAFQGGQDMGLTSGVPADWLLANSGNLPNAPGCPGPQGGTTANDPVMLKLRIRVPTNARSFSVSSNFFSSEYPEWVCSAFNDFFVVLLDSAFSGSPANPTDKNLARYTAPDTTVYPVGVNLAFGNTGLFTVCLNGPTGCGGGSVAGTSNTCLGTGELVGTGFDIADPPSQFNDPGWCGASNLAGGGTGWLVTSGNVEPGEVIELRFAVWDTGDPWYDSVVLLDNFQWSVDASEPGTVIID